MMPASGEGRVSARRDRHKRDLLARLHRIEGQVRGVCNLIEKDDDCEKIAQQMAATRKALDKAFYQLLGCALECELLDPALDELSRQERLQQMTALLAKYG